MRGRLLALQHAALLLWPAECLFPWRSSSSDAGGRAGEPEGPEEAFSRTRSWNAALLPRLSAPSPAHTAAARLSQPLSSPLLCRDELPLLLGLCTAVLSAAGAHDLAGALEPPPPARLLVSEQLQGGGGSATGGGTGGTALPPSQQQQRPVDKGDSMLSVRGRVGILVWTGAPPPLCPCAPCPSPCKRPLSPPPPRAPCPIGHPPLSMREPP